MDGAMDLENADRRAERGTDRESLLLKAQRSGKIYRERQRSCNGVSKVET